MIVVVLIVAVLLVLMAGRRARGRGKSPATVHLLADAPVRDRAAGRWRGGGGRL